ncbi:reverse transcriptase family protein [Aquabacterium sp. A7-Y]|uniref:reverse transcriptase family protein n=1 Tax=Aquabacterium sp. A7-Y TaxID=1349605 RepID=UPI00223CC5EC|nr:reverse transcriptase family protein [Aquabacterium sp. A7-Y]MCW7540001.1 reverse transcriptase family protein [Aquabacterium sp. A7-Y]
MKRGPRYLAARGIARTVLAGAVDAPALRARLAACLVVPAGWRDDLARRLAAWPPYRWRQHDLDSLTEWLLHDARFGEAWQVHRPPVVRRYILRPVYAMRPAPLGLHEQAFVPLATPGDLAAWLGLANAGLWRLVLPAAWQRRRPLGEQHYRFLQIPKPSGGVRLIEAPEPYLKGLQRRLLDGLLSRVPVHDAVHGYVAGRSVVSHAAAHAGREVVLRFDLQDFFNSVPASRVHALWRTLGYPLPVVRCLTALCTVATPEVVLQRLREDGGWDWAQAQRRRDAHLPQGAPTSAALANLCAFGLDLRLAALAESFGARYTRYADDLVISGDTELRRQAARIEPLVAAIVREEGFRLNHRKTFVAPARGQQRVCGIVVNERPNLPREAFDRLKASLHRCVVHGPSALQLPQELTQPRASALAEGRSPYPESAVLSDAGNVREHLRGRIAWVAQLNPAKASRLMRLYEQIDWTR